MEADHTFGPVIRIWKDLGPMCFWSHGQSFSGKVYETKVTVHLPNSKEGQALTHTPIPLPLHRVGGPKWAQGKVVASNHPHSSHVKREKLQIYRSNLTHFRTHLPCHLSPHNTICDFNIMTRAMPGSSS